MTLDVDLWFWPLDAEPQGADDPARHLSAGERARAARYVNPDHARAYGTGRGRLREILAGYTGIAADTLVIETGPQGKPYLAGGPAFNLSHAAGWAALAVAPGADAGLALGIDIEGYRTVENGVAARFFSASEYTALSALPPARWDDGFFRCWTRKEAVVKAMGTGLSMPLDRFDVSLAPGEPARVLRTDAGLPRAGDWQLRHLDLGARLVGALAVHGGAGPLRTRVRQGRLPLI